MKQVTSINQSAIKVEQEYQAKKAALVDEYEGKIKAVWSRDIFETGQLLKEYKDKAGHGSFMPLLKRLDMDDRRAREYMQAYDTFLPYWRISANMVKLSQSAIFLLSAPSTPKKVRDDIVQSVSEGEKISYKEIKDLIDKSKPLKEQKQSTNPNKGTNIAHKTVVPAVIQTPSVDAKPIQSASNISVAEYFHKPKVIEGPPTKNETECPNCRKYKAALDQANEDCESMVDKVDLLDFIKEKDNDYYNKASLAFMKSRR